MQFRDLNTQYQRIKPEIDAAITQVIEGGQFILGGAVAELEQKLADYTGAKHCVSCANGTDALQLVLMAWGIGPGDAVLVPDFTFFASAGAASAVGAHPVFTDIDLATYNMDPASLDHAIQKLLREGAYTPKVIIPVDLFGLPADHLKIKEIADTYGLKVLEDGAQGFGGRINGQKACSFGDAAITSFFPAKPLGCYGDGGAIFTDDEALAETLRSLRAQGRSAEDKYDNQRIGMNSRLDTLQAGILLPKLKAFADYELDAVNQAAARYSERLTEAVVKPLVPEGYLSSWAQYTLRLSDRVQRDNLQAHLKAQGIPSMVYYPRGLHQQSAYQAMQLADADFPHTAEAAQTVLSLPMHPYLTEEDIEKTAEAVNAYIRKG